MSERCKSCNQQMPEKARFCPHCGASVSEQTVICKNCKTENPAQAKYCKNCGSSLSKKSKLTEQTKTKPTQDKPFYLNRYFIIMAIAFVAMIVATYYNFSLINSGKRNVPVQNVPQNQGGTGIITPSPTPVDPSMIEETANQLKQDPNNMQLNVQMGNMLFDSQKYEDAIPYYNKALELEPGNPDVIVDVGVCYFNLDDFARAKELFQQALTKSPNHINALYNLGVVSVRLKEMDVLMDAWSKLVEIAPESPQAAQASQILDEIHSSVQQN
jgi:cytochrome c-type biogenesis protein CcmH/NrfG